MAPCISEAFRLKLIDDAEKKRLQVRIDLGSFRSALWSGGSQIWQLQITCSILFNWQNTINYYMTMNIHELP
jgi:hypothetical protein